jgi:hypothetical protein
MEKFLNGPLLKVIRDVAATVNAAIFLGTPLLIGSGFLIYHINARVANEKILEWVGILVGPSVACATLIACFYIRHIHTPALFEIEELEGILTIERVENHYRYTMERRETIRARRSNLRLIEHRTHYTGEGSSNAHMPTSLRADHQLFVGNRTEEDGRRQLWIYLGEPLGKGESVWVGTQEIYEDDQVAMKPYYRKGPGGFKARNLTVKARFPIAEDPGKVQGLIWNNDRKRRERATVGTLVPERILQPQDGVVEYIVNVSRPKRYHSYGIRWRSRGI